MLRIEGTGDHAFYSFRATSEITSTRGLTGEDTVSGRSAAGAVAGGTDAYTFEGDLRNLYVGDDVRVFLNGERIDPDSYESVVSLAGDGNYTSYAFVTTGEITGMRGLTGEDTTDGSRAAGAVGGGTDSYTLTGTFAGLDTDGDATVMLNGQPVRPSQFPNTLRIEGTGDRAFYSLRATGTVDGSGLTGEDTVSGATASGAVGGGADTYTFGGDLRNLYVQEGASVFLNGEQIDPDSYESVVSFAGDGDRTDYTFAVKNGRVTGTQSLTGEDTVSQSNAAGAVGGGTDSYTVTGTFEGLDTDGDATVVLNGQSVAPDPFDKRLRSRELGVALRTTSP
jgi:hypothetical protein